MESSHHATSSTRLPLEPPGAALDRRRAGAALPENTVHTKRALPANVATSFRRPASQKCPRRHEAARRLRLSTWELKEVASGHLGRRGPSGDHNGRDHARRVRPTALVLEVPVAAHLVHRGVATGRATNALRVQATVPERALCRAGSATPRAPVPPCGCPGSGWFIHFCS
jgi:hypothetical protein